MSRRKKLIGIPIALAVTAALMAAAHAWLLPPAVRAGWLTASIERELAARTGMPAHVGGADLPEARRLVLHDVSLEFANPAVKNLRIETVRIEFDRPFPWGRATSIELTHPTAAVYPELWKTDGGNVVTVAPDLCRKLRRLPALDIVAGEIEIHTTEALERIVGLRGRIEPGPRALGLQGRGAIPGGPADSFVIDGSLDFETGRPTLQATTVQPALPAPLRRLLASLLDVRIEDLRVRERVRLDRGAVEKTELAMEPKRLSARILSRGRDPIEAFGLRIDVLETSMDLSGQFNEIRLPLGDGGVAELTGAFSLSRGPGEAWDGVARILAAFYARDGDAEPVERADLVMDNLAIRGNPASLSFDGSVLFSGDRTLTIAGFEASETRAHGVGSIEGWRIEALPWALAVLGIPGIEGPIDAGFDATWENGALKASIGVTTGGLRAGDAWSFSAPDAVRIEWDGDRRELHGTLRNVTTPAVTLSEVAVDFAGTKRESKLVGNLTIAAESTRLAIEGLVDLSTPAVRGYGELTAADGPSIGVSSFEVSREPGGWTVALEGAAKRWNLENSWPLMWRAIGVEPAELHGLVDVAGRVARRGDEMTVDVSVESAGWTARWGGTEVRLGGGRFRWTPILAGAARSMEIEVAGVTSVKSGSLEVEIGPIRGDGRWTHALDDRIRVFQDLKLRVDGVQALRGTAYFDGRADAIELAASGTYDGDRGRLKLDAGSLSLGTWGRATIAGEVDGFLRGLEPHLVVRADAWPLEKILAAAGLAADLSGLAGRGTVSGEWRIESGAGSGSVRAALEEISYRGYRMSGVAAEIPILYGRAGEAGGSLSFARFEYPGGSAGGTGAAFRLTRRGEGDLEVALDGAIAGEFCGGTVAAEAVRVHRRAGGAFEGEASLRAEGVDLAAFSALAGLEKPIRGSVSGRFEATRFSDSAIVFAGEGLRGAVFGGDWTVPEVRIEDPFGPMTTYAFAAAYERANLRMILEHLIGYGVLQGGVSGSVRVEVFHTGEPTNFEIEAHDVPRPQTQKALSRKAVANLIASFNATEQGRTISHYVATLPDVPQYDRLGFYARLDRDGRLAVRGRYFCDPDETTWGAYSLSELRSNVVRGGVVEHILVGEGEHRVDIVQRTPAARPRLERVLERLKRVTIESGD